MVRTIVEGEMARLRAKGMEVSCDAERVELKGDVEVMLLGDDSLVLSDVVLEEDGLVGNEEVLTLTSDTWALSGRVTDLARLGMSLNGVMRGRLVAKRVNGVGSVVLECVRITAKRR